MSHTLNLITREIDICSTIAVLIDNNTKIFQYCIVFVSKIQEQQQTILVFVEIVVAKMKKVVYSFHDFVKVIRVKHDKK